VDPVRAFAPFADRPLAAFLDSAGPVDVRGARNRYSYIATDPFKTIRAAGDCTFVDGVPSPTDPFSALAAEMARYRRAYEEAPVPFRTGAVGFFGYELGGHLERLPAPAGDELGFPDMAVGLYDTIAAFDTLEKRAWVLAADSARARPPASIRARALAADIAKAPLPPPVDRTAWGAWTPDMTRARYEAMIRRAIEYIYAGDVFQVNLAQRFVGRFDRRADPFALYRRLRALNPAPYAAFLRPDAESAVVSASPECFLRLTAEGHVATWPIKGTCPRGTTPEEDAALAAALQRSDKDRAENLMIVDLLRNDLSRVCAIGSVETIKLFALESFATVHHLVSEVRGDLMPGTDAVDLLRATFPGGSITGAPKIRAMEIIGELEPVRRGPYCGAVAWLGFDGAMEASIVIRTLTVAGDRVAAQAGGGIVADSDPAREYAETLDKIGPLLRAFDPHDGGGA
jgi:para-aminobenzoate synthetase component 1